MRQLLLVTITFCLLTSAASYAQSDRLSEVDKLYYTCKIWGFLKYYHPLVSRGSYNWDEKLQNVIDKTSNIQTYSGFSTYMARWIYAMGPLKECRSCRQRGQDRSFSENFDLSWTQNNRFSDELKKHLRNIENNRFQGDHYYIAQGDLQQFEPKNENQDFDFLWKDKYQRLLPLFRYWNFIEYFSPYKYLTDQPWDDVLREMIPKFLAAETKLELHMTILELVVKLDDTNSGFTSNLIEEMPYFNYLPVKLEIIENQVVVTEIIDSYKAEVDDLQVGDILIKVNDQYVNELHNAHKKHIWASNKAGKDRSISYTLFMGMKEAPKLTIKRNGVTKTDYGTLYGKVSDLNYEKDKQKWTTILDSISYELTEYDSLNYEYVTYDSVNYVNIGYVNMGAISTGDVVPMMRELMETDGIVFDVRNNPRGTYKAIAKYLNPTEKTFAAFTKPDLKYPGKFVWQGESTCGESNPDYYKGKVILLVNENTQSHAEFTCMCLQTAPNVTTIGSRTAGANSNTSRLRIIQRLHTSLSGIGVYYPDGRATQRTGIVPDLKVKRTLEGIREGRDEYLEKAIEVIKEEIEKENENNEETDELEKWD